MRRLPSLLVMALLAALLVVGAPVAPAQAAQLQITGRVVLASSGLPPGPTPHGSSHQVRVYAGSDFTAPVTAAVIGADGRFAIKASGPEGPYRVLVVSGRDGSILPTWHGGERGEISDHLGASAAAPAATDPVVVTDGAADVGDIEVGEGARVRWSNVDGRNVPLREVTMTARSAETGRTETFVVGALSQWGVLLDPGPQQIDVVASPLKASGHQRLDLDLPSGYGSRTVTWPTEFFLRSAPSIDYDDLHPDGDGPALASGLPARRHRLSAVVFQAHPPRLRPKTTYQWFRGSRKIRGATRATYRLTAADDGRKVRFRVRLRKEGYPSETWWSPRQRVASAQATVSTSLPAKVARTRSGAKVNVRVRLSDGSRPRGQVHVVFEYYDDDDVVQSSWPLRRKDRGVIRVRLPHQIGGAEGVYVRFVPTDTRDADRDDSRTSSFR